MAHCLGLIRCEAKSQWQGRMFLFLCITGNIIVDNLLLVSPGNWHSCSQANVNNLRGDSYEVLQEKSAFTAEDRCMCPCQGGHQRWSYVMASPYCSWM